MDPKNDEALTLDLKTTAAVSLSFDKVQSLRDLHDVVLSLSAFCGSSLNVLKMLDNIQEADLQGEYSLSSYYVQLCEYEESLSVLGNRIRGAIELVSVKLSSHSPAIT